MSFARPLIVESDEGERAPPKIDSRPRDFWGWNVRMAQFGSDDGSAGLVRRAHSIPMPFGAELASRGPARLHAPAPRPLPRRGRRLRDQAKPLTASAIPCKMSNVGGTEALSSGRNNRGHAVICYG